MIQRSIDDTESDEMTCEECGCTLRIVSNLGGEACLNCQTFYAPYGFEKHWTVE